MSSSTSSFDYLGSTTEKFSAIHSAKASTLTLVATSHSVGDRPDPRRHTGSADDARCPTNYFKSAQWSGDGTCVITNSGDNHIRTFVIPPDMLDGAKYPHELNAYCEIASHDATDAVSIYPRFDLQDVNTTLVLSTIAQHPIRLHSALTSDLIASYPLIKTTTETYLKPLSLAFTPDGSRFVAGSNSLISVFDLSRPGQEPVVSSATGPRSSRTLWDNPTTSMRGLVSALAIDAQSNVLAAGTTTRCIGLYDAGGAGACLGVFGVQDTEADRCIGGRGILQVLWSPCGKYLYIAERKSQGLMIYDIRKTGQLLGWLEGRPADTNQRLLADVALTDENGGHDIWAGGTDGYVQRWQNPHLKQGAIAHDEKHFVHHDVVSSSALHPTCGILATVSGQRHLHDPGSSDQEQLDLYGDNSLKVWVW